MGEAEERWLELSQEEQEAVNARRLEAGELPIPTHRQWPPPADTLAVFAFHPDFGFLVEGDM